MEDEEGKGGTLSGKKRLVYALLKILKKIHEEADSESSTSFLMKYTVENALKEEICETKPVTKSLKMVLQNWSSTESRFVGICKELKAIGITEIRIEFEKDGGGLEFIRGTEFSVMNIEEGHLAPKSRSPFPIK